MANTYNTAVADYPVKPCAISWAAIFGGAVGAVIISLILLVLGSGLGLSSMSPWTAPDSVASITLKVVVWLIIMQWIASAFGGYLAGRLRNNPSSIRGNEVFFRDTAHGFLAWGISTIFTVMFFAAATASFVGAGVKAGAMIGAAGTVAYASNNSSNMDYDRHSYEIDSLFRPNRFENNINGSDKNIEAGHIIAQVIKDGEISNEDRSYLVQLVSSRTNISLAEAEARVNKAISTVQRNVEDARIAGARFSIYMALAMLVGAFISGVAGACGGLHRDQ